MIDRLRRLGIELGDCWALRRISMTLHRWHELECGDGNDWCSWAIERDEATDRPFMVQHRHKDAESESSRWPIPDREKGAMRRLDAIMARYPNLVPYVQGDPRGASLYVLTKEQTVGGHPIDSIYSRGVGVYK